MEAEYLVLVVVALATIAFAIMMLRKPSAGADATSPKKTVKVTSPAAAAGVAGAGAPSADKKLPMVIYFASQSGTAETYAVELAEQAKVQGFNARVVDLEEFDEDEFPTDSFVVFLAATFGEGEPPDNTQRFWEWIRNKDRDPLLCKEMNFACFALGNRQYEHFCAVGRTIDERMRALGARAVCELGEGDDDGSLEDDYNAWKLKFWPAARAHFGLAASGAGAAVADEFKSTVNCIVYALPGDKTKIQDELFSLEVDGRATTADEDKKLPPPPPYVGGLLAFQRYSDPKHKADTITCTVNRELRQLSTDLATTRHLEFALPRGCRLKYQTSHNLGVFPRNDYKISAKLAARLRVDTRTIFKLEKKPGNRKLPLPMAVCSVQDALLWYCDFMSVTRAKTLKILAQYATDEADKARLLHWANDGKDEFHKESMNLLEVLEKVPSVHPPWAEFIEWCPKLQPRFYTISSSSKVYPDSLHLTVAMTVEELPGGRRHLGVCSSYLANLRPDKDSICAFVRKSTFDLPKVANTPVIMVGPGTGVAPFRGFWQEIRWHREQAEKKLEAAVASNVAGVPKPDLKSPSTGKEPYRVGPAILFFGCRQEHEDFLYKDEMLDEKSTGVELVTAFSRESKEAKMYVQHRIIEQGERLWTLLQRGAVFYTCGGTGMGREVRAALQKVVERHGAMTAEQAHAYVELMQKANPQRFIQELWS